MAVILKKKRNTLLPHTCRSWSYEFLHSWRRQRDVFFGVSTTISDSLALAESLPQDRKGRLKIPPGWTEQFLPISL